MDAPTSHVLPTITLDQMGQHGKFLNEFMSAHPIRGVRDTSCAVQFERDGTFYFVTDAHVPLSAGKDFLSKAPENLWRCSATRSDFARNTALKGGVFLYQGKMVRKGLRS